MHGHDILQFPFVHVVSHENAIPSSSPGAFNVASVGVSNGFVEGDWLCMDITIGVSEASSISRD